MAGTIEEALKARLAAVSAVTNIVQSRIYPNVKPQDAVIPCISYRLVFPQRYPAMGVDSNVVKARYQFDVWTATYAEAKALAAAIRTALKRYRNTAGTPPIFDVFDLGEVDLFDDDTLQQHIACDYEVNYSE